MADNSSIEWTNATWNPVRGCTRVSPGCELCYAEGMAARFSGPGKWGENFAEMRNGKPRWTGQVALLDMKLDEPLQWKKPRRIFVNSTSDLFHERLSRSDIARVFDAMYAANRHTFQVLTKRAARMREIVTSFGLSSAPNIWLGVSVENQPYADERIPHLLDTPAAVRFVSYEPAIGPVDFTEWLHRLGWIIVGGESGRGARPFALEWARSTVRQCKAAGVPVFVKQLGANPASMRVNAAKGNNMEEWPEDLRVREFPK